MQTDINLLFINASTAITSVSVTSNILDLSSGLMSSTSSPVTYNTASVSGGQFLITPTLDFGEDLGPGALRLRGFANIGATTPSGSSATNVTFAWQGAADTS